MFFILLFYYVSQKRQFKWCCLNWQLNRNNCWYKLILLKYFRRYWNALKIGILEFTNLLVYKAVSVLSKPHRYLVKVSSCVFICHYGWTCLVRIVHLDIFYILFCIPRTKLSLFARIQEIYTNFNLLFKSFKPSNRINIIISQREAVIYRECR